MPGIDVHWYDQEKSIQIVTYEPDWTWEDFHVGYRLSFEAISAQDHPIVIIHDNPRTLPKGSAFSHLNASRQNMPANVILSLVVYPGTNALTTTGREILKIFIKVSDKGQPLSQVVDSFEEALRLARERLKQIAG